MAGLLMILGVAVVILRPARDGRRAAHAGSMPRPALRLATEKLDREDRARYLT